MRIKFLRSNDSYLALKNPNKNFLWVISRMVKNAYFLLSYTKTGRKSSLVTTTWVGKEPQKYSIIPKVEECSVNNINVVLSLHV